MEKVSAVYKIVNTVTGDCYVGSSVDVKRRWKEHKSPSKWTRQSNSSLYQAFQKYGLENFRFQILVPVMPEYLKQVEQELIEMLQPAYNNYNAKGLDAKRQKETHGKCMKEYRQTEKGKESHRNEVKKYQNQRCSYNGQVLTLDALAHRLRRAGVKHAILEAKKYLI